MTEEINRETELNEDPDFDPDSGPDSGPDDYGQPGNVNDYGPDDSDYDLSDEHDADYLNRGKGPDWKKKFIIAKRLEKIKQNEERLKERQEERRKRHDEMKRVYNFDMSEYLINGRLKRSSYPLISGGFHFRNFVSPTGEKKAEVRFFLNNPLTEIVVSRILNDDMGMLDILNPAMARFGKLINLVRSRVPFISSLKRVFNNSVKYISTKRIYEKKLVSRGRGRKKILMDTDKVEAVINPETKRVIKVNKKKYRELYGKMILKKVVYKKLSTYDQIDYDITENCAVDYLIKYENYNIKDIEKILDKKIKNDISTDEFIKIFNHFNVGIKIYDCVHNVYYESETEIEKVFKLYGEHLYVLRNDEDEKPKRTKRVINDIEDIDKYKNNRLIVTDRELGEKIKKHISENYVMVSYTDYQIPYKSNLIIFDESYTLDKQLLKDNSSKCRTVYNMINGMLELTGHMNIESFNSFYSVNKIRFQRSCLDNDKLIDLNKAYPFQLSKKNIKYGIPSINDYWEKYDDDKYCEHGFYYCELNSYDDILAVNDNVYSYYATEILKKEKRIKKIVKMFIPSKLSIMTNNKIDFLKEINVDRVRAYIGWLLKRQSYNTIYYDTTKDNGVDIEALNNYYCEELTEHKNCISINKVFIKKKTGILANTLIKELSNIDLYNMNKIMLKLNPKAKLNSVRTDSLGYVGKNIKIPDEMFSKNAGSWKIEDKKQKVLGNYKNVQNCDIPDVKGIKISEHNEEDMVSMIDNDKSFIIHGDYGTGKTYSIYDKIVPALNDKNKKYIISSITKDNSERIKGCTVMSLFFGKTSYQILNTFKDIDYIIIDEATLLFQDICVYLDYVKQNCKTKFILLGDDKQSKGDAFSVEWNKTYFLLKLTDMNMLEMTTNHRNDEKLIKILDELKIKVKSESWDSVYKFVLKNFNTTKDLNIADTHICRHTKTKDMINNIPGMKCETVTQNQGNTINKKYVIHDLKFLPKEQFVVALSRSTKWEYIYVKI